MVVATTSHYEQKGGAEAASDAGSSGSSGSGGGHSKGKAGVPLRPSDARRAARMDQFVSLCADYVFNTVRLLLLVAQRCQSFIFEIPD